MIGRKGEIAGKTRGMYLSRNPNSKGGGKGFNGNLNPSVLSFCWLMKKKYDLGEILMNKMMSKEGQTIFVEYFDCFRKANK